MKNLVIALVLLALIAGAIIVNAVQTKKAAEEIEEALSKVDGSTDQRNADRIAACSALLEEKRPVYEKTWVVDMPAYDEEIVTGYICSVCGSEKEP